MEQISVVVKSIPVFSINTIKCFTKEVVFLGEYTRIPNRVRGGTAPFFVYVIPQNIGLFCRQTARDGGFLIPFVTKCNRTYVFSAEKQGFQWKNRHFSR
ncbi:MAG: hypothetical protein E6626_08160 [Flavonifractor plautii]|nr:hypothetical protein [Flavonifractor plautii]